MITELPTLFDVTGREAPDSTVDLEAAIAQGRRTRSRHQVFVGAAALTTAAAVVAGTVAVSSALATPSRLSTGPGAGGGSMVATSVSASAQPPSSANPKGGGTPPARVAAVSLPDPVPGWPVRRWTDAVDQESVGTTAAPSWVAAFGLAVRPDIPTKDSSGNVTGGTPDGPQATILAGEFDLPLLTGSTIDGNPVVATPTVAGVQGYVTTHTEKGTAMSALYFSTGHLSVEVFGFDHVTTDELVALGNALNGLS